MPREHADQSAFDDPVLLLAFSRVGDVSERSRVRGRLEAAAINCFVNQRFNTYRFDVGDLSEVRLYVNRSDLERARETIGGPTDDEQVRDETREDGLQELRKLRRFKIARFFLYAGAIDGPFAFLALLAIPWIALFGLVAGAACLGLAQWSREDPRRAFGWAFGLASVSLVLTVATRGFLALVAVVPVIALYFVWEAAGPATGPPAKVPN